METIESDQDVSIAIEETVTPSKSASIITEEQRQALIETRTMVSQGWTLNIAKPTVSTNTPKATSATTKQETDETSVLEEANEVVIAATDEQE